VNYLAHLYLAGDDPESFIGGLMGDFVKGAVDQTLPPTIRHGVWLHRRIDSYTDAHPTVMKSKRRIRSGFRRYAGILVDLYYDHFLARDWSKYSDVPLDDFAQTVYRVLDVHHQRFPAPMQRSMSYMTENRLLQSYRELSGIERALRGIETRLKRPIRLREAIVDLQHNHMVLAEDFATFFPDLVLYVRQLDQRQQEVLFDLPR
jgi:acyl carrier protein phosphodiesterase